MACDVLTYSRLELRTIHRRGPMAGVLEEDWGALHALGTSEVVDNTFIGQHDGGDTPLPNYTEPVSPPSLLDWTFSSFLYRCAF